MRVATWRAPSASCRMQRLLAASLLTAAGFASEANPAWETYKLEKYIQQATDLLLCKVRLNSRRGRLQGCAGCRPCRRDVELQLA